MSDLVTRAREVANRPDCSYGGTMDRLADRIEALEAALQSISEMGPMAVDDQRWRIAQAAIKPLEPQKPSHPAGSESTGSPDAASSGRVP